MVECGWAFLLAFFLKRLQRRKGRWHQQHQACCQCGGGHTIGTEFTYRGERLYAKPRIAKFYALDEGCGLGDYNLTFDPQTGRGANERLKDSPVAAFSVECQVTAIQSDKVQFTTKLVIEAFELFFETPVILSETSKPALPKKRAGTWSDWKIDHCLPTIGFARIDAGTGELSSDATASTKGAVIGEGSSATPQPSAVCSVSAVRTPASGMQPRFQQVSWS